MKVHDCGAAADVVEVWDDEDTGNELARYRCENGHEWVQPTTAQVIRMIGWGHRWREYRDLIQEERDYWSGHPDYNG